MIRLLRSFAQYSHLGFDYARFPFNWKTLHGYLVAFTAQWCSAIMLVFIYAQVVNIVFEACWIFSIFARDMKEELATIIKDVQTVNESGEVITERFVELVKYFSDLKK